MVARGGRAASDIPITLVDGGVRFELSVPPGTVLDLLRSTIYALGPLDRIENDLAAPLLPGTIVRVVRRTERVDVVEETISAPPIQQPDPELAVGETRLIAEGRDGRAERMYAVRVEDGVVLERRLLSETVLEAPVAATIAVGARPLVLETPFGAVAYSRSLNVLATYYTPATCGKTPDSPTYGITATGARATRGVVAVDPRVIPLYSWLYIPGYGIAQARDVGSAIIGDHIDVAFDDGDGAWWGRRYLTVYVLAR